MLRRPAASRFLVLATLGLLAVPAEADTISGSFEGVGVLTPTQTPGVFEQDFTGVGEDTALGPFTTQSHSTVDFSLPPDLVFSEGMVSLTFAQGTLLGTSSGTGTASGLGTATFEVALVFTGGTGLFAGATGGATITGTIVSTGPTTNRVTASYDGSLTLIPEPGSLTLFALGAAALVGAPIWRGKGGRRLGWPGRHIVRVARRREA